MLALGILRPIGKSSEENSLDAQEQVRLWQTVFDLTYSQTQSVDLFDFTGWKRSVTGLPFSAAEMQEWLEDAVSLILRTPFESVLEIGCGTGLLVHSIAPYSKDYTATDISEVALEKLAANLNLQSYGTRVKLLHQAADKLAVGRKRYDLILLNSVIQYFPSLEYLEKVLETVIEVLKPEGRLFVGDIRNADLLHEFHDSVGSDASREKELLVAPRFFECCEAGNWQLRLKRGRAVNELTKFRYNGIFSLGSSPKSVVIQSGIPNPRLMEDPSAAALEQMYLLSKAHRLDWMPEKPHQYRVLADI